MCTRIVWADARGAVVVGRNMDYHRDLGTNLWKLPRGVARDDGVEAKLKWTSKHGSVIAAAFDMFSVDGMNEAGLAGHVLWLAESDYGSYNPALPVLNQSLWLQYFLDNHATVAEAVSWVKENQTQVFPLVDPASGEKPALHLALEDGTGDSAIFEYIGGEVKVHHGREYTVMTNSPVYEQQLELLKRVEAFGGSDPLPGSTLASDRFARAAYYVSRLAEPKTRVEAIAAMFSVMRNAAQPFRTPDQGKPDASQTIWQVVADLTNRRYVFESTTRPNVVWVDFADLDFREGSAELRLDLGSGLALENGIASNVSAKFTDAGPLCLLTLASIKRLGASAQE